MVLNEQLIKVQFKLDHMPVLNRILMGAGSWVVLLMLWFLLIYLPLSYQVQGIEEQITKMREKYIRMSERNERMQAHIETGDLAELIVQYNALRNEKNQLEEEIKNYRYQYINDQAFADLLHSILKDMDDLSIEHFSTVVRDEKPTSDTAVTPSAAVIVI